MYFSLSLLALQLLNTCCVSRMAGTITQTACLTGVSLFAAPAFLNDDLRETKLYLSIYCLLLISNSLSETWKNCLEGATDFKEVECKPCVCYGSLTLKTTFTELLLSALIGVKAMDIADQTPFYLVKQIFVCSAR